MLVLSCTFAFTDHAPLMVTNLMFRMAHSFKVADGLRWSPYLDEYLSYLARHSAEPQDKVLITLVKMQLIVNQVQYSLRSNNVEIPPPYVDALQSQLDDIAGVNGPGMAFGNNCEKSQAYLNLILD